MIHAKSQCRARSLLITIVLVENDREGVRQNSQSKTSMEGDEMPNSRTLLKLLFLIAFWSRPSEAQSPQQHWVGRQLAENSSQALILNLTTSPDMKGTVDLPEFGASGIPASNLATRSGNIHFELVGDNSTAVFDGTMRGDIIQGSWKEGDHTGRFELLLPRTTRVRALPAKGMAGSVQ